VPKIAFIDIDDTLIESTGDCHYNNTLIEFIANANFDAVYLVTGRNPGDLSRFVIKNPLAWKQQLIPTLIEHLKTKNIAINGVSLPFDLYLNQSEFKENPKLYAKSAGETYRLLYESFEKQALKFGFDSVKFAQTDAYRMMQPLTDEMQMWLAMNNDFEKKGQFGFLMQTVLKDYSALKPEAFEVYFWDDKPENLQSAKTVFEQKGLLPSNIHTVLVESVSNYKPPSALEAKKEPLVIVSPAILNAENEIKEYINSFNAFVMKLRNLHDKQCVDNKTKTRINQLCDLLTEANAQFSKNQTVEEYTKFKSTCRNEIERTKKTLYNCSGIEQIKHLLKSLLGLLAIATVIPALIIIANKSTDGYKNMFFRRDQKNILITLQTFKIT